MIFNLLITVRPSSRLVGTSPAFGGTFGSYSRGQHGLGELVIVLSREQVLAPRRHKSLGFAKRATGTEERAYARGARL